MDNPINSKNKVKRVPNRGFYDQKTIYKILDEGYICHISFLIDDEPFIIPTMYARKDNTLLIHGASSSRLLTNLKKGIKVCVAVTHVNGLVLAKSAFHHSLNYQSVVIFGVAREVSNFKKNESLKLISDNIIPKRWEEVRLPTENELKATTILAINIDQASAKIRTGDANDDKQDQHLKIWSGVIPLCYKWADPIPSKNLEKNIFQPASVNDLINKKNQ